MSDVTVDVLAAGEATLPTQARRGDAGYDLTSAEPGLVAPGGRHMFGTGIAVAIPEGYVGYIKPRSGLAAKHGIDVLGGVIDAGYRGEIKVILLNTSVHSAFMVHEGDRIAQLVIQPVASATFRKVTSLPASERAEGGFGSTGTGAL